MDANNVITFPDAETNILDLSTLTKEAADDHLDMMREYVVDEALEIIIPPLYNTLENSGFGIPEDFHQDAALISEAIKSLMLKHYNIFHPLQQLAQEAFKKDEDQKLFDFEANSDIIDNISTLMKGTTHEDA